MVFLSNNISSIDTLGLIIRFFGREYFWWIGGFYLVCLIIYIKGTIVGFCRVILPSSNPLKKIGRHQFRVIERVGWSNNIYNEFSDYRLNKIMDYIQLQT